MPTIIHNYQVCARIHEEGFASHLAPLDRDATARRQRAAAQGAEFPRPQRPEDHGKAYYSESEGLKVDDFIDVEG
jgi:hypothetical protein